MGGSVEALAIDTELFGFQVGRIQSEAQSPEELHEALEGAKAKGYKLLYWTLDASHPSVDAIEEFVLNRGDFVCSKVTYRCELNASIVQVLRRHLNVQGGIKCSIFDDDVEAAPELLSLSVAAGQMSRFGSDPSLPDSAFRALYTAWMKNSVAKIAADAVLVARDEGKTIVGMVTVRLVQATVSQIGLLAVAHTHRRRGLGIRLMLEAYEWSLNKGAAACTVATQTSNWAARSLYERCGGIAIDRCNDYHFWTQRGVGPSDHLSNIPNQKAYLSKQALTNVSGIFSSSCIQTHHHFGPLCEERLKHDIGVKKALLVGSGTGALEMCALCIGAEPGIEVIVPSFTFVSTANAFVTHGATPVLVDIRADTQNIDERKIEEAITPRTRAICVVHYAGVPCEMDTIMTIARKHNLLVVEDNAHGVYSSYKGRMLGSIGDCAALSFHYTKNLACGEGGALLLNNPTLFQSAFIAWEKGTNRMDFLEGKVDKYKWVDKGGSYVLSELSAAVLHSQLEERVMINESRMRVWTLYHDALEGLEAKGKLVRPIIPEGCTHNAHIYYIRVSEPHGRANLDRLAKDRNIGIFSHYHALHGSPGATKYARSMECPESMHCSTQLRRLPIWVGLSDEQAATVIALVHDALTDGSGPATI